jgi:transcriptional regulator with XRE-family HTH domain
MPFPLLERGKIVPGLDTLVALSKGLGITLRDLLDFDDSPSKDSEVTQPPRVGSAGR